MLNLDLTLQNCVSTCVFSFACEEINVLKVRFKFAIINIFIMYETTAWHSLYLGEKIPILFIVLPFITAFYRCFQVRF